MTQPVRTIDHRWQVTYTYPPTGEPVTHTAASFTAAVARANSHHQKYCRFRGYTKPHISTAGGRPS